MIETIHQTVLRVLRSRRFIVALATLAIGVLMLVLPDLNAVEGELLILLISLALALIGGYSVGEAARLARQQPVPDSDLRVLVRELIDAALDEALKTDKPDER